MAEGLTPALFLAAASIWLFGFIVTAKKLPLPAAFAITTIKTAIPLVYFAAYYDGTWNTIDDFSYQAQGAVLLHKGFNPLSAIATAQGLTTLGLLAGGQHFLYGWWNLLGQYLFGEHYWSPVFLNVGLTFIAGIYLTRILEILGFERSYRRWLLAFFLLHWDVLTWSSLLDIKDTLVMALTVIGVYGLVSLTQGVTLRRLAVIVLFAFLVTWIRFYLTFIILLALGLWMVFEWRDRRKFLLLAAIGAGLFFSLQHIPSSVGGINFSGLPFGLFLILLTPQPGNISPAYTFEILSGWTNLLMFGPMLVGGYALWRRGGATRLPLVYMILTILFYAVVQELAGPRQRYQLVPIYAWLQFHPFWMILQSLRSPIRSAPARPEPLIRLGMIQEGHL